MHKPTVSSLLKEIKSEEIEQVYIAVTKQAVEWAVAGFIEEANQLLQNLWAFGTPHSGDLWVPDQGLLVMWHLSGKWPANIPFAVQDVEAINKLNYNNLFFTEALQGGADELPNHSIEAIGNYILNAEKNLATQKSDEAIRAKIDGYEKQLAGGLGYRYFEPATRGAILSARLGDTKKAEHFIMLWGKGYSHSWANYILAYLMRDVAAASILLTGILAPVFDLTKERIQQDIKNITTALQDRYATGRQPAYGSLTWQQLLQKISGLAIAQESNYDFTEQAISNNWLGNEPAQQQAIEAAEARLGVVLPEDYKQFLLASNGFAPAFSTAVTLAPVSDIQWYNDHSPDSVEIWSTSIDDDPAWGEPFKNSIIIGGFVDEQEMLLLPFEDGHWECWFLANWVPGERRYPSLRYYIEEILQRLE